MKKKKAWTVEAITKLLQTNDFAVLRAGLVFYRHQTNNGTEVGTTGRESQGVNCQDAPTLIRLGRLLARGFQLRDLPEYRAWAKTRMLSYCSQLARIANRDS